MAHRSSDLPQVDLSLWRSRMESLTVHKSRLVFGESPEGRSCSSLLLAEAPASSGGF